MRGFPNTDRKLFAELLVAAADPRGGRGTPGRAFRCAGFLPRVHQRAAVPPAAPAADAGAAADRGANH
ncbi:MAG: hypothetical protein MZV70_39700 [Desulfobacterales bacterium]|nr:hypothetical protein [Desulfobacterales bacterium]